MKTPVLYIWESYPEYKATQQFSRCLGRILASLPAGRRSRLQRKLIRAAIQIAHGIAGAHAEVHDEASYTRADRERMRASGLAAVGVTRDTLLVLRREGHADLANVVAALELLERIEHGLKHRPLPD